MAAVRSQYCHMPQKKINPDSLRKEKPHKVENPLHVPELVFFTMLVLHGSMPRPM